MLGMQAECCIVSRWQSAAGEQAGWVALHLQGSIDNPLASMLNLCL